MKSITGLMSFSGFLIAVSLTAAADVKPGAAAEARSAMPEVKSNGIDPFFTQQWHFQNMGQKYQKDLDDTRNFTVIGLSGADVSMGKMTLPLKLKRQVIVAVLDSGIDVGHEELKPLLLMNDKECKDGKVPTSNTGDLDKNGLDGDCLGWNFTSTRFARLVQDDVGHGTHVAGLVASVAGNSVGVSGYSNDIRILPLKVYDDKEEGGAAAAATRKTNISDRVADALDYAVKRGAEVVNLSMGWPLVSHTEKVKSALDRAIAAGLIVVAGAGNDSHGSPIYPCAHPGVLCVGAMDGDGNISSFSNLAGHVDIFGPGDHILSTWPMAMTSDLYGIRGYEYRSGTSQASPLVAGAVAVLRGMFPEEGPRETLARLLSSVRKDLPTRMENGAPLTGLFNLDAAIQRPGGRTVRAFWKGSHLVDVHPKTADVTLTLNLQN
ncbi:MAG: S8 family serine peptidase, partial [Bdellovibrionales bacterium]|nr:S8 family serine peptidase [Bdellovibrionales bacterium]